jgi:hypothetical protein
MQPLEILSSELQQKYAPGDAAGRTDILYLGPATGYSTVLMQSTRATPPGRTGMTALPLAVSYGAVPLASAAAGLTGTGGVFAPFLPWLLLAGAGTVAAMLRPGRGRASRTGRAFNVALFALLAAGLFLYAPGLATALAPAAAHLHALSPPIMLLLCLLWAATCGLPDRADLQRFGALLGFLCIADLAVETAVLRAVPAVRLIGDADVLAGLLLVALCAGLRPGPAERGMVEPDQGRPLWRGLVMLGLLACLSRPGLFAGAWVVLCFGRGSLGRRALYAVASLVLLGASFLLPVTASDSMRFVDYWLWLEALKLWAGSPLTLLTGFSLSAPLPVEFPAAMTAVWETATGSSTLFGVSIAQVPSFWLRSVMAWGVLVPLALLAALLWLLVRRPSRMGAGLAAALFAQGMSTPLLYDPATAAPVLLAFMLALRRPGPEPGPSRIDSATAPDQTPGPAPTPPPDAQDVVDEWDLRPL